MRGDLEGGKQSLDGRRVTLAGLDGGGPRDAGVERIEEDRSPGRPVDETVGEPDEELEIGLLDERARGRRLDRGEAQMGYEGMVLALPPITDGGPARGGRRQERVAAGRWSRHHGDPVLHGAGGVAG